VARALAEKAGTRKRRTTSRVMFVRFSITLYS
jgi:hypothetical protein